MRGGRLPAGARDPGPAGGKRRDLSAALPANGAKRDPVAKLVKRLQHAAASGEPMSLGRRARIRVARVAPDVYAPAREGGP
jgi:hypothetical protein